MKISPCFIYPQGILGVYDFFISDESNQSYIKIVQALSSFIMAWVGAFVQQSKSSHIKRIHPFKKKL